jgi:hypothetical protein
MSIKSNLQQNAYQSALKKQRSAPKNRKALNFKQMDRIALLFDLSQDANIQQIALDYANRLKKLNKKVSLLAYTNDSVVPEGLPFDCFCKKDTNWANVPKSDQIQSFLQEQYDLLISLYLKESPALDFILQAADAQMIAGYYRAEHIDWYDLMVHNKETNLSKACEQLQKHLNWINK